jgi:hypothetical protein
LKRDKRGRETARSKALTHRASGFIDNLHEYMQNNL